MSNLTPTEQLLFDIERLHAEESAQDKAAISSLKAAYDFQRETIHLLQQRYVRMNERYDMQQETHQRKLKLTIRGAAVIGFLAGAVVATIITTYAIWASNTL